MADEQHPFVGTAKVDVGPAEGAPPEEKSLEHTLQDLASECVLFTPALLVTHGYFDRDPVIEFLRMHKPTHHPFKMHFDQAFFSGLGKTQLLGDVVDWDYRLYGIAKEGWEICRDFIGSIALYDPHRYHFARLLYHELEVVDPIAMRARGALAELPTVTIHSFAVSSNRNFVYLAPATDPPRTLPYPTVEPAKPSVVTEADILMGPPPDPAAVAERLQQSQAKDLP